jgi:hypothetical protein
LHSVATKLLVAESVRAIEYAIVLQISRYSPFSVHARIRTVIFSEHGDPGAAADSAWWTAGTRLERRRPVACTADTPGERARSLRVVRFCICTCDHETKITCVAACRVTKSPGSVRSDGSRPRGLFREAQVVMATIERAGTRPSWAARSASRRFATLT